MNLRHLWLQLRQTPSKKLESWFWLVMVWGIFAALLLGGIGKIALGLLDGPNFSATRIVVVDQIAQWRTDGRHGTEFVHWTVDYHYQSHQGLTVSGRTKINPDDPGANQIGGDAKTGDEVLLRIGVAAGEPGAVFGFNQAVREGMAMSILPLVWWFFSRGGLLMIDPATGRVMPDKRKVILLLAAFFGAMLALLWLTSPVIR